MLRTAHIFLSVDGLVGNFAYPHGADAFNYRDCYLSSPCFASQAYVLLVYLAITTKNPKYIAFASCLGGLFLLIACNILVRTLLSTSLTLRHDPAEHNLTPRHNRLSHILYIILLKY